ncbi:MAG: hypothetical protein CMO10_11970 [Thalassospira sp.]|nr:hypothetical protein [Thalassospira sp.]|tara:strand:- start:6470 stop:7297 length:828 start_codon:yes stop_codon:yes gene_type:complete
MLTVAIVIFSALPSFAAPDPSKATGYGTEIRFAVAEWPPLVTEDREDFGRLSARITEIFSAMGYEARFDFLSWPRALELTRRGDYVATFPWLRTPERVDVFHIPVFAMARALHKGFYKKSRFPDGLEVTDFNDLVELGLRPVGITSYWHAEEFAKYGITGEIVANPESAWRFLEAGRADILFEEEEVGWVDLKNTLGEAVAETYATTSAIPTSNMFILFSRHHPDGERLKLAFDDFMASEQGQGICEPWSICTPEAQTKGDASNDAPDAISDGAN